ncbi:MAG TPA: aminoglycoside phosphotransferase family protein [Kouleothrix sp.]|uniref:phosphotransferase family protein n=1 Tax=Kouleothrix sp. TaxID=2779161 RepID=UPI002CF22BE5|nr:aminoglycoside phosphotransferase family protein [Kouleothrix sp.]
MTEIGHELQALAGYLDCNPVVAARRWRGWHISPVAGGANNLLYRATHAHGDYALKFTLRDDRDRAGREYAALVALAHAGVACAPRAVWHEQQRYRQPLVVQMWLDGPVLAGPPASQADWQHLLDLYCAFHRITPLAISAPLAEAVLNLSSGADGRQLIFTHLARIPTAERPPSLAPIVGWLEQWTPPVWDAPPRALCRVDGNWRNFIRSARGWAAVDWENSGWGDPAFDWADLITHPAYAAVPPAAWEQLIAAYAVRMNDPQAIERITTYTTIMWIWWATRWARFLYEVPRGLDPRLVERPAGWLGEVQQQYARYLARAEASIRHL